MTQKPAEIFEEFFRRYAADWPSFVRDVWGVEPDPWQVEVLAAAQGSGTRLLSIRSGKGAGKTACLSWISILHMLYRFPQKSMCTSPSKPQLGAVLIPEMRQWIGKLPKVLQDLFIVKAETIELAADPANSFLTFRTARDDSPESLQGLHSTWVLAIVDEASDASNATMESIMGILADPNPCIILAGNPLRSSGYFWATHREFDNWKTWKVSVLDSPRHNPEFPKQVLAEYGERSNAWRVQILGEFPAAEDDSVIPYEWIEGARRRWETISPSGGPIYWGVDVARFGDDGSALAKRQGNTQLEPTQMRWKLDTMQVVGWVKNEWDTTPVPNRPAVIFVDVIGLGSGVTDRLRELGLPVRGINVSELPALTAAYKNCRTELWWKARQWFERMDARLAPGDDTLPKQLAQPRYTFHSSGAKVLESKDDTKRRLGKSPDAADAFVLTFAGDAAVALYGRSPASGPIKRNLAGVV